MLRKRQIEVLNLIKLGKANKNIASELFISLQTVKTHVSNILEELKANDRAHAVYIAIKRGIIK